MAILKKRTKDPNDNSICKSSASSVDQSANFSSLEGFSYAEQDTLPESVWAATRPPKPGKALSVCDLTAQEEGATAYWLNMGHQLFRDKVGEELFDQVLSKQFQRVYAIQDALTVNTGILKGLSDKIKRAKLEHFQTSTLPRDGIPGNPAPVGGSGYAKIVGNPKFPEHGLFRASRIFRVRLRHNNLSFEDDAMLDGRVTCLKFADLDEGGPLDLIMHTGRLPQFYNADSFQDFTHAFKSGKDALRNWCFQQPMNYIGRIENVRRLPTSYYNQRYYSHMTYIFEAEDGVLRIARLRLVPADGSDETGLPDKEDQENVWDVSRHASLTELPTYLRDEYNERLSDTPLQYRLQIQLQDVSDSTDPDPDPDADPSSSRPPGSDAYNPCIPWDTDRHPWLDAAIITITTPLCPHVLTDTTFTLANQPASLQLISPRSTRDFSSFCLAAKEFHGMDSASSADDSFLMTRYKITTTTGKHIGAGTDGDVCIIITGSQGRTHAIKLDHQFYDDFERGQIDEFMEVAGEVGEMVLVDINLSSLLATRKWFLENVTITDVTTHATVRFPCYQWLSSKQPYVSLPRGAATVPHRELLPVSYLLRKYELTERRRRYQWQAVPGLPGRIKVDKYEDLPREARLHTEKEIDMIETYLRTLANGGTGNIAAALLWDIFSDNQKLLTRFLKDKGTVRKVMERWQLDEEFGRQILNGPHPTRIERVAFLPDVFCDHVDTLETMMERDSTLEQELEAGYIYMLTYPELDELEKCRGYKDKYKRYLESPTCLLYVRENGDLVPIAIHVSNGETPLVFTPRDSKHDWLFAKMWAREADAQIHHVVSRHLHTQLVMETVTVATMRNLASVHPVFKLLLPHLRYTLAVNVLGRGSLYPADDGLFHKYLAVGGQQEKLLQESYRGFHLDELAVPKNLKARRVDDRTLLPRYYYRDDATDLWNILHKFVRTVLTLQYWNDSNVQADEELQTWIQDLRENGLPESDYPSVTDDLDSSMAHHSLKTDRSESKDHFSDQESVASMLFTSFRSRFASKSSTENEEQSPTLDVVKDTASTDGNTSNPEGLQNLTEQVEDHDPLRPPPSPLSYSGSTMELDNQHGDQFVDADAAESRVRHSTFDHLTVSQLNADETDVSMSELNLPELSEISSAESPGETRQQNHGVPASLSKLEQLVDLVTTFIFTASCQHAALTSGIMDYYGFVPNAPTMLLMPPPAEKGVTNMSTLKKALPSRGKTAEIIAACYTVSRSGRDEVYLGEFPEAYFDDEPTLAAIEALQEDLSRLTDTINERNSDLDIPYTYLLPGKITNSASM